MSISLVLNVIMDNITIFRFFINTIVILLSIVFITLRAMNVKQW